MRLDLNTLNVQSFDTSVPTPPDVPAPNTGQGGPESYCWICEYTGNTMPTCAAVECHPLYTQIWPPCIDTWVAPVCTVAVAEP